MFFPHISVLFPHTVKKMSACYQIGPKIAIYTDTT